MQIPVTKNDWNSLSELAWNARSNAHLYGKTKVGAAALSENGKLFSGCNVEHMFRSHDIHAEVNVISTMVATGEKKLIAILIAAERERFTPCGSCMDWIFQFGGAECKVAFQSTVGGEITVYTAEQLMPYYPS